MSDHIKMTRADGTWVVRAGGAVLAETADAVELREGSYPSVIYFPRDSIAMAFFEKSPTQSTCPYKGRASYYTIVTKSTRIEDAGWSYEAPKEGMERIKGHVAFYPDRVTIEQL